jgi:hypothetical protein
VRLHPHDRAQDGLEQIEQIDSLIAENAALGAPRADGSADAMAAGDEPARAAIRLDPPDLDADAGETHIRQVGQRRCVHLRRSPAGPDKADGDSHCSALPSVRQKARRWSFP